MALVDQYHNVVKVILSTFSLIGVLTAGFIAFSIWFGEWRELPNTVKNLNESVRILHDTVSTIQRDFTVVDILGGRLAVLNDEPIESGGVLWLALQARANAGCEREVEISFFSHRTRAFVPEKLKVPAVRSAVSDDYQLIPVPVTLPDSLRDGFYRYSAEIVPIDCPGFRRQTVPLSDKFEVKNG